MKLVTSIVIIAIIVVMTMLIIVGCIMMFPADVHPLWYIIPSFAFAEILELVLLNRLYK